MTALVASLLANAKTWRECDLIAGEAIRDALDTASEPITTRQLAALCLGPCALEPKTLGEVMARKRFYAAVQSHRLPTNDLADCASRDPVEKIVMGKPVHGWLWAKPAPKEEWE